VNNHIPLKTMSDCIPNEATYGYNHSEIVQNIITACVNAQQARQNSNLSAKHIYNIMGWVGVMCRLDGEFWEDYVYSEVWPSLVPMHAKGVMTAEDCNQLQGVIDSLQLILSDLDAGRTNDTEAK